MDVVGTPRDAGAPRLQRLAESDFNQLLSLTGPGGTTTFQYDPNGNRTQKVEPAGTTTFTWDARDRLAQVTSAAGTSRFGYDPEAQRVSIADSAGSRRVLMDAADESAEYDQSGSLRAAYIRDVSNVDLLLAAKVGTSVGYIETDGLGSVYGTTDPAGSESVAYGYDAYGARQTTRGQSTTSWGHTGRPHLVDAAALVYHRNRYRDTSIGAWLTVDPLEHTPYSIEVTGVLEQVLPRETNYGYVAANPIRHRDPQGLTAYSNHHTYFAKFATVQAAVQARGSLLSVGFQLLGTHVQSQCDRGYQIRADMFAFMAGIGFGFTKYSATISSSTLVSDTFGGEYVEDLWGQAIQVTGGSFSASFGGSFSYTRLGQAATPITFSGLGSREFGFDATLFSVYVGTNIPFSSGIYPNCCPDIDPVVAIVSPLGGLVPP